MWITIIAVAVLLIVGFIAFGGSGSDTASATSTAPAIATETSLSTTTIAAVGPTRTVIRIARVSCSGETEDHPCSALTDRDPSTVWGAPQSGAGAEFTVEFVEPARVAELVFTNDSDDVALTQSARIREYEIHFPGSDLVITGELEAGHGPYRVTIPLEFASGLSVHVRSVHEGDHSEGVEPTGEMTLAEIRLVGIEG